MAETCHLIFPKEIFSWSDFWTCHLTYQSISINQSCHRKKTCDLHCTCHEKKLNLFLFLNWSDLASCKPNGIVIKPYISQGNRDLFTNVKRNIRKPATVGLVELDETQYAGLTQRNTEGYLRIVTLILFSAELWSLTNAKAWSARRNGT